MKIVLLPGMDGTGRLLKPLARYLSERHLDPEILHYPHDRPQSYAELIEDVVVPALPKTERFVLLGESFSGPIALALAQRDIANLAALVLVVTFAQPPREMLLALTKFLPVKWMLSAPIPCWVAHKVMLGGQAACHDQDALCSLMKLIQPEVLSERLREIRELRLARREIHLPSLYIRATEDLLLPDDAVDKVKVLVPELQVVDVKGPHLVLDTAPDLCADYISDFVASLPAG